MKKSIAILLLIILFIGLALAEKCPSAWPRETLMGVDQMESAQNEFHSAADILSCYFDDGRIRVRLPLMQEIGTKRDNFTNLGVSLDISIRGGAQADIHVGPDGSIEAHTPDNTPLDIENVFFSPRYGTIEFSIEPGELYEIEFAACPAIELKSYIGSDPADYAYFDERTITTEANCAFMHHGNQSLSYTDVFRGRWDDGYSGDASGFDEVLEAHQTSTIPGNFHISGTLQSAAAWYDPDFNTWISNGVTGGWIEVNSSAYAQHIMPFVSDEMNNWSVSIENDMVTFRYGFTPRVAWVPERTFLDGPGGAYPNSGVSDWIADDFADNGIYGIILDDTVHLSGHDNHQIHYLLGSTLKMIPRDNFFTGDMHAGNGAGAMSILTGLAAGSDGPYRIVVYADDWEMAAEMGEWASSMSNALDTYEWMIEQCNIESSWLHTWKLSDAVIDPDFNGDTFTPTFGTHSSIGGSDGYGGASGGIGNQWYLHWASYASPSDSRSKNFGNIWNDAKNNLITATDNNCAQSGWYVLMSMLYETGWHDGLGGAISGWEMKHSTHMKNANVYAEAARWAAGTHYTGCGAFYDDWDDDGSDELIIHNNRVCAVFEHIGGRAHWIFGKGGITSWEGSIAGNCNVYWEGTEGDYNDANHIAPLSDVSVGGSNYQHNLYYSNIDVNSSDSSVITLGNYLLKKKIKIKPDEAYLRVYYDTGPDMTYIKSGFTPDLVDVIWNAQIDRLWNTASGVYCGWYNPNEQVAGGIILGNGGANHSTEFQSTILKGDEVSGQGGFGFLLYAGEVSGVTGMTTPVWNALSGTVNDIYPPKAYYSSYHPGTDVMEIAFGDPVQFDVVDMSKIGVDSDGDGVADVTLDVSCSIINTVDSRQIRIQLSSGKASVLEALTLSDPYLWLDAGAFVDIASNANRSQTAIDEDPVTFNMLPNTSITIDGYIDTTEWISGTRFIDDPDDDSDWGSTNELYDLYMYWDETYLYFGLHGVKEAARSLYVNSWLIYLDSDWGGSEGETDLTEISAWDRNAQFTGGFMADIQYGSWGTLDGDVWDIQSPTLAVEITDGVITNTDLSAERPGSEIAISWNSIYGLGEGIVPSNCDIAVCASIAGSSDDSDLGGDCIPNQISAVFPVLDSAGAITVDSDGDGIPDDFLDAISVKESDIKPSDYGIRAYPNPFNSALRIDVPENCSSLKIFDIQGRLISHNEIDMEQTTIEWNPSEDLPGGIYLIKGDHSEISQKVIYMK